MIRIHPEPEPGDFDRLVRSRGKRFLDKHPSPSSKQLAQHNYWVDILPLLRLAYNSICAYTCHWVPPDTGWNTIDHFRPKDRYPKLAYEWANYRYVCGLANARKGTNQDVLDPFKIEDGWFTIDFPTLLVRPSHTLPLARRKRVLATIDRLKLNDEPTCVTARQNWLREYCWLARKADERSAFEYLTSHAPFLATELDRQQLRASGEICAGFDLSLLDNGLF